MNSFDLFDTLIGRRCGKADNLFSKMAEIIGDPDFPEKRKAAERVFQEKGVEYNLDDIYAQYGKPQLAKMEWQLELDNVFPIRRNVLLLGQNDIIVSDMYLSEGQLRELIDAAGIEWHGKMYVSCYGKFKGTIWDEVKKNHSVTYHYGDNPHGDVANARRYGINGKLVETGFSTMEKHISGYSEDMAWWMRRHRLENLREDGGSTKLNFMALQYNLPLLYSFALLLKKHYDEKGLKKLLFMSRDCQLLHKLFTALYPKVQSEYIYISRECLRNKTESYFHYLNARLDDKTSLVDMAASCGSLKVALPMLNVKKPNIFAGIFLKVPFNVDLGPINCSYITTNVETKINNTMVEMMNYGTHWHVANVTKDFVEFDEHDEYEMKLVQEYHHLIEGTLKDMPTVEPSDPKAIFVESMKKIHDEGLFLKKTFPNHLVVEKVRKRDLFMQKEHDLVIVGAINGYAWDRVRFWWESIKATGYNGEIHMLIYDRGMIVDSCRRHGIIVHESTLTHPQVVVSRFKNLAELCRKFRPDQWVVFPDVSDIVFQWNPGNFLSYQDKDIVVASEGVLFSGNKWTDNNLRESFPEHYERLNSEILYNAGSIAARAGVFAELAQDIYDLSMSRPMCRGHDQAAMNLLIRTKKYKSKTLFTDVNDVWCFCAASSLLASPEDKKNYLGEPVEVRGGWCYTQPDKKVCMFHHYTRDRNLARKVQAAVHKSYQLRR